LSSLGKLAIQLGLHIKDEQRQVVVIDRIAEWLQQHSNWLLVIDDAPDPGALARLLPHATRGHVLITSVNPNWNTVAQPVPVECWTPEESVAFLQQRTSQDAPEDAEWLAQRLGGLPLALEQAGAYVEVTGISLRSYCDLIRSSHQLLLRNETSVEPSRSVGETWAVTLKRIDEESPRSSIVLAILSFMAPSGIPLLALMNLAKLTPNFMKPLVSPKVVADSIATLRKYSLITASDDVASIHPLLQEVVRARLPRLVQRLMSIAAMGLILSSLSSSNPLGKVSHWFPIIPHALTSATHANSLKAWPSLSSVLFFVAGALQLEQGHFSEAQRTLETAVRLARMSYRKKPGLLGTFLATLAFVELSVGNLSLAYSRAEEALSLHRADKTPPAEQILQDLRLLALTAQFSGDLDSELKYAEQALAAAESMYGSSHAEVGSLCDSLANLYGTMGRQIQAAAHADRAKQIYASLPPQTREDADALRQQARAMAALGDLAAAKTKHERALALDRALLGHTHYRVVGGLEDVRRLSQKLGDMTGAWGALEEELMLVEQVYGAHHPLYGFTLESAAKLQQTLGNHTLARDFFARALAVFQKLWRPDHPHLKELFDLSHGPDGDRQAD
jgi:tetratricopeptide (TPR) repeat protein